MAGQPSTLTLTSDTLAPYATMPIAVTGTAPSHTHLANFMLTVLDVIFRDSFQEQ